MSGEYTTHTDFFFCRRLKQRIWEGQVVIVVTK